MVFSPVNNRVEYHALSLGGEVGEACNKLKKHFRGDFTLDQIKDDLIGELGGVCWYAAAICNDLKIRIDNTWGISPKARVELDRCGLKLVKSAGIIADFADIWPEKMEVVVTQQTAQIFSLISMIGWHLGGVHLDTILQANLDLITDR